MVRAMHLRRFTMKISWLFWLTCVKLTEATSISPLNPSVAENGLLVLTCTYSGTGSVNGYQWERVKESVSLIAYINNQETCAPFDAIPIDQNYDITCPAIDQSVLTIKNVSSAYSRNIVRCTPIVNGSLSQEPATANVTVTVPTGPPSLLSTANLVQIIEGNSYIFNCSVARALPEALISWYMDNRSPNDYTDDMQLNTGISNSGYNNIDGTMHTNSTLSYTGNKDDNGMHVYCAASNGGDLLRSNTTVELDILYTTDGPPVIVEVTSGTTYNIIENERRNITCRITGGNPRPTLSWSCNIGTAGTVSYANEVVSMIIELKPLRSQNGTCICNATHAVAGHSSVIVNINVLFPPDAPTYEVGTQSVAVLAEAEIKAYQSLKIKCKSNSNPQPSSYTWTLPGGDSSTSQSLTMDGVGSFSSGMYTCSVVNMMVPSYQTGTPRENSSTVTVAVLSRPSTPTFHCDSASGALIQHASMDVVINDTFTIVCNSSSVPSPAYHWKDGPNSQNLLLTNIKTDTNKICTATNTIRPTGEADTIGTNQAMIDIHILYPPSTPILKYRNSKSIYSTFSGSLKVLEGGDCWVNCSSTGKPTPAIAWLRDSSLLHNDTILSISAVSRQHDGAYTCQGTNFMGRTCSTDVQEGKSQQVFKLDVLFSPAVDSIGHDNVEDGHSYTRLCPFEPGNPPNTSISWKRVKDNVVVSSKPLLEITYVNHSIHDSDYNCVATNQMKPDGEAPLTGQDSKFFHLNVWYPAYITSFGQAVKTINETITFTMRCVVESNPKSTVNIYRDGKMLVESHDSLEVEHQVQGKCLDAGLYKCEGFNNYTISPAVGITRLYVNCGPRPHPDIKYERTITSKKNENATLSFPFLAYPRPNCSWERCNNTSSCEKILENSTKYTIITTDTFANLTINYIKTSDFKAYKVASSNGYGNTEEEMFELIPQDKPDPPMDLQVTDGSIDTSSVTLEWVKGFNGGLPQTFVIQYRKLQEIEWTNVSINETDDKIMNISLSHLESDTTYVVQIFAFNRIGESFGNPNTTFNTIKQTEGEASTNAAVIGAGAGVASAAVVIIAVVVIVVVYRRRAAGGKNKAPTTKRKAAPDTIHDSDEDEEVENAMYQSAGAFSNASGPAGDVYAKPIKSKKTPTPNAGGDIYAVVDKKKKKGKTKAKVKSDNKGYDVYENAPASALKSEVYANAAFDESTLDNAKNDNKLEKNYNKDGLLYADLDFANQSKGQRKLVIHGLDDMTEYADVDLTKRADPLPDSDGEQK